MKKTPKTLYFLDNQKNPKKFFFLKNLKILKISFFHNFFFLPFLITFYFSKKKRKKNLEKNF